MNSLSKTHFEDSLEPRSKSHHKLCPITLKCGTPNSVTIPIGTPLRTTFLLTSTTINTSCFCKPVVKLKFSSYFNTTNLIGDINLQIFKLCENQLIAIPVGSQFTFTRVGVATVAQTFTFFVCDCDTCFKECCTYTVVATSNITRGTVDINAASLTVSAIESINNSCK